jgi:hypothetical protein
MILDYLTGLANVAIVASLLLLAYQIYLQRQDLRFSEYEALMSDFSQMTLFLVDHPQIERQVYPRSSDAEAKLGSDVEDKQMASYYLDSLLGLCERAWWASKQSKARREDWIGWRNWLKALAKNPLFVDLFNTSEGEWDPAFRKELASIIKETQTAKAE